MVARDKAKATPPQGQSESLPYVLELWGEAGQEVERVLARASTASLGRAIFEAAIKENGERRICLRHGARLLAESRKRL